MQTGRGKNNQSSGSEQKVAGRSPAEDHEPVEKTAEAAGWLTLFALFFLRPFIEYQFICHINPVFL